MGNRITRAATHLPREAVQKRMQEEQHPWRRQRWQIIYQALTPPRQAEDIARTVGVSPSTVHRVIAAYNQAGVAAIDTPGKGGRRQQYLTLEQEQTLLQPFLARAARGEMATAVEIKLALEARIGHEVNTSTLYRLLDRHGWQQIGAEASPAQAKAGKSVEGDMVPVREERRSAQGDAVARWERRQQAPLNTQRKLSPQRYPSDLHDQEWAIVEPLIPPAKPGGRPRSIDMRAVIDAIFYVDRTGCQWRALPHDFPPWSTVWTYFRTWRNDGTWERIHTALREASIQDHNGGKDLLLPLRDRFPRLKLIWVDSAYKKGDFVAWVKERLGWEVEVVEHPWSGLRGVWVPEGVDVDWEQIRPKGFHVLKWRWVVETTQSQDP